MTFSPIDWFIVSAYLIFSVAIGMIGRRYVGSVSHYLVAGRELGVYIGIATLAATEIGTITFMYNAELGYRYGFAALPIDSHNERYEELAAHPEWSFHQSHFSKQEILTQRDRVFARHPSTTFVAAHFAEKPENLEYVGRLLDSFANVYVDLSARAAELGRQPYTARNFFLKYSERILFGTDLVPEPHMYRGYFRFLETDDQYFEYPSHASRQGRWNIYGLFLPDEVLRRVYHENACRLLKRSK